MKTKTNEERNYLSRRHEIHEWKKAVIDYRDLSFFDAVRARAVKDIADNGIRKYLLLAIFLISVPVLYFLLFLPFRTFSVIIEILTFWDFVIAKIIISAVIISFFIVKRKKIRDFLHGKNWKKQFEKREKASGTFEGYPIPYFASFLFESKTFKNREVRDTLGCSLRVWTKMRDRLYGAGLLVKHKEKGKKECMRLDTDAFMTENSIVRKIQNMNVNHTGLDFQIETAREKLDIPRGVCPASTPPMSAEHSAKHHRNIAKHHRNIPRNITGTKHINIPNFTIRKIRTLILFLSLFGFSGCSNFGEFSISHIFFASAGTVFGMFSSVIFHGVKKYFKKNKNE